MERPARKIARPSALLMLLLAALFVRAFLPQGTMIEAGGHGGIAIALCNSDDLLIIPVADDRAPAPPREQAAQGCVFAGHGAAGDVPAPLAAPAPRFAAASAFGGFVSVFALLTVSRTRPPARAPPILA